MTPDEYVNQILTKYQVDTGTNSTPYPGCIEQPGMIGRDFRPWLIREAA